jgi:aminopeptidase N
MAKALQGMACTFERHDGQAVTCDDFAQAIADANPGTALALHLPQFKRWYAQAGTPRVQAVGSSRRRHPRATPSP